ncbi:MAG: hypothetical protein H0X41_03325 [Chitinophagaceae bacterium]|nr:hypothetical protein [Chitinophagaceae bacterium]
MAKLNHHRKPAKKSTHRANADSPSPVEDANLRAHRQADWDIENDVETSAHSANDDLDEGELARLGEDNNPVE